MLIDQITQERRDLMSIEDFITDLLNVDRNSIEKLSVVDDKKCIKIYITLKKSTSIRCQYCGGEVNVLGYKNRTLKHSTFVNRKCMIIYHQRRYICKDCSVSFIEQDPFAKTGQSVTTETTINVLTSLKKTNFTYTDVAEMYNLSVTKVQRLFDNHVDIKRKTLPTVLSLDEHYFPQSDYDSIYICVLMDFSNGTLIDVLPDRKKDYLIYYFDDIKNKTKDNKTGLSELDNVKYVSTDLWDTYRDIAHLYFPKATLCADSFHIIDNLTKKFTTVKRRCRNSTNDKTMIYLMVKFKNIFNHGFNLDNSKHYNSRLGRYVNYRDIMNILFDRFPELKEAYYLKESYIDFNSTATIDNAKEKLAEQIELFGNSGIPEYLEFYNTLINWRDEIVNSFNRYNGKRINNSYIESMNNKIERLLYNAKGYVNFKRARNRILYCLNKNDTYKM